MRERELIRRTARLLVLLLDAEPKPASHLVHGDLGDFWAYDEDMPKGATIGGAALAHKWPSSS
jgi:hypothetical protein